MRVRKDRAIILGGNSDRTKAGMSLRKIVIQTGELASERLCGIG
jgi:hypothetical protein